MRVPRVRITIRGMLFLVAVIAAYVAGVVSQNPEIERKWKELESVRKELSLASELAALIEPTQSLRITSASDLDHIEELVDQLDAYDEMASHGVPGAEP